MTQMEKAVATVAYAAIRHIWHDLNENDFKACLGAAMLVATGNENVPVIESGPETVHRGREIMEAWLRRRLNKEL